MCPPSGIRPAPFHFYLCAPSRTDAGVVSRSTDDAVMVLVPVPPIDETLSGEELQHAEVYIYVYI